jgi:hypothetical protein
LAHELGHAVRNMAAKDRLPKNIALEEGMATWAAGTYWTDWQGNPSFQEMVKDYLRRSVYIPLYQSTDLAGTQTSGQPLSSARPNPNDQIVCLTRRDILYTEWAGFIDFLIQQYGLEKITALFQSGRAETIKSETIIYPPDYAGTYGLALNQLEAKWLDWIQ